MVVMRVGLRTWGREPMAKAEKPPATPPPPPGRREIPAPPGRSEIPPASAAIALFFGEGKKKKNPEKSRLKRPKNSLVRLTREAGAVPP